MSKDVFEQAGLHRLTAEELAYLNRYLGRTDAPPEQRFGAEQVQARTPAAQVVEVDRIQSHITGKFEGWSGKTVFRLANGQVWKQRVAGRYRVNRTDPAVTIERGRFGYYLVIDDTGRKVGVNRLK